MGCGRRYSPLLLSSESIALMYLPFSCPGSLLARPLSRTLFANMEWGAQDPLDPVALISALQLDHAIQQDGQEFLKLFLGLMESRFDTEPQLRDIIRVRGGCMGSHAPAGFDVLGRAREHAQ